MSIVVHADHAETERVALDEAVASFTDALRSRGYEATVSVAWSGEARTESLNRDGTGGGVLESERAPGGQTREAEAGGSEPQPVTGNTIAHKGGGYYDIVVNGEVVETVRGKAAAEAWTP